MVESLPGICCLQIQVFTKMTEACRYNFQTTQQVAIEAPEDQGIEDANDRSAPGCPSAKQKDFEKFYRSNNCIVSLKKENTRILFSNKAPRGLIPQHANVRACLDVICAHSESKALKNCEGSFCITT